VRVCVRVCVCACVRVCVCACVRVCAADRLDALVDKGIEDFVAGAAKPGMMQADLRKVPL
jgi:hypothetical protein